ncbi:MAG: replication-relaxation family protein [Pseudonocardiaceae bacterium]
MNTVHRLRLAAGAQLERLHFADLAEGCCSRIRRRVLARLTSWRVLATLPRRVGGIRAGSTGLIYHLDTAGVWLIRHQAATTGQNAPRRPAQPSAAFTSHTLAVTELYVHLVEHARAGGFRLRVFDAEPACWWPDDLGGQLKPDAHTLLATSAYQDAWWIEVDQATETLPRLKKKLASYLDFARRGGIGPAGVLPRVLLTTPTAQRCAAITGLITGLPPPAEQLFHAVVHKAAADLLIHTLLNP